MSETEKVSIFIATPMYGGQCFASYTWSCLELQKLCTSHGIPIKFSFLLNESLIHRGRNDLVAQFLKSDATHLIFVDADIGFNAHDIGRLIGSDKDVIGGTYPKKRINWDNVRAALKVEPTISDVQLEHVAADFIFKTDPIGAAFRTDELVRCIHIPTGFMCIKRKVLETLVALAPSGAYVEHNVPGGGISELRHKVFDTGINEHNEFLSEDFWFCNLVREAGFEVWMDPSIVLTHTGSYIYKGHLPYIATLMSKPSLAVSNVSVLTTLENNNV